MAEIKFCNGCGMEAEFYAGQRRCKKCMKKHSKKQNQNKKSKTEQVKYRKPQRRLLTRQPGTHVMAAKEPVW